MTFSSSSTTAAPLHVSTIPQHSKTKCQQCKMFHFKPMTYDTLTISQCLNKIQPFLHGETAISHGPYNGMVFNSYLRIWQKSPIIKSLLQPHDLMQFWQIAWVYHPMRFFHVHLCDDLHIVCQHPHNLLLKSFHMENAQNSSMTVQFFLPHLKTITPHHLEAYHAQPPKPFSAPSHCPRFWPLHSPW